VHAVRKYLTTWAEPETALAGAIGDGYARAVVVPACRESATLLDGYALAAANAPGRTLVVVVVNGSRDLTAERHMENAVFLEALLGALRSVRQVSEAPPAWLGVASGGFDVAVLDRSSGCFRLPQKSGVGLARKIGMDLSLALHVAGKVRSSLLFTTDADATLPPAHFTRVECTGATPGAVIFPFWHDAGDDPAVARATALYELSLRYYVAGLGAAGSPYAFHTLGSALGVHADAYAAVRGTPKREAGEDFYLLGKVAKVAPLVRASGEPIMLRARASDRTPFGTGAGVQKALECRFYAPECFTALGAWLRSLDALAEHGRIDAFFGDRAGLAREPWDAVETVLFGTGGRASLAAAIGQAPSSDERRARLHEWFDAFRTLKFIHALRDALWPSIGWEDAASRAPFVDCAPAPASELFVAERRALAEREARTPAHFGPGGQRFTVNGFQ
jgi:hypothetical protein